MLLASARATVIYAYSEPVDLRKGYDGLAGLVTTGMKLDVLSGGLFLFVSRHRTSCKVLHWDGTGLCLFAKRLERGRFAKLDGEASVVRLSSSELSLFIEGCRLVGRTPLSPREVLFAKPTHAHATV